MAVILFVVPLRSLTRTRPELRWLLVVALPLCPLVNLYVKKPLLQTAGEWLAVSPVPATWPWWFIALALLLVGVTEEAAKFGVACTPGLRRRILDRHAITIAAVAIGAGYAIGEMWFLAARIYVAMPELRGQPFYAFNGFISERLIAAMIHVACSMLALSGWLGTPARLLLTLSGAMLAHAVLDLPSILYQSGAIGLLVIVPLLLAVGVGLGMVYVNKIAGLMRTAPGLENSVRVLYVRQDGGGTR
jgi:uncharacterized membrane protein YhfC